ncbi:unnamed protein product, partial [Effrenium voratum]
MEEAFLRGTRRKPWCHQLEAVQRVQEALAEDWRLGRQQNLLVQHATGSGKSATMALLVHCLRNRTPAEKGGGMALVLLLSDRVQLDQQLGDTVELFLRRNGDFELCRADGRHCLVKVLSAAAQHKTTGKCWTVVTTKQKLDRLLSDSDHLTPNLLAPVFQRGRVAIICEECHRSHFHGCATSAAVRRLFGDTRRGRLVYIGFTGTPSASALRLFGRVQPDRPEALGAVHCYHLGQAEEQGVVMDVLPNYEELTELTELPQKSAYILADLQRLQQRYPAAFVQSLKAMVVCASRADVVSYVLALRKGSSPSWNRGVCGFFSGEVQGLSEERLNGLPFHEALARSRVLVVCNKLETGFDEPRLSVMYLDRCLDSPVKMVQVLSRVNRPFAGKEEVFVRDFHGQAAWARSCLAAFRKAARLEAKPDGNMDRVGAVHAPLAPLHVPKRSFGGLLAAARLSLEAEVAVAKSRMVFIDEKVAQELLQRVVPSTRYGGLRRRGRFRAKLRRLAVQRQVTLEAIFKQQMQAFAGAAVAAVGECVLRGPGLEAKLRGPEKRLRRFWEEVDLHGKFFEAPERQAHRSSPYPVFICTKGRAATALLGWRAAHVMPGRSFAMDKYRKVMKPREEIQKTDEEIRVTAAGSVSAYVSRAATVFNELKKPYVIVQATGNALTKAVTAAEVIKRRFKGLHQITELKTVEITDEYEPLEEGLDK